MNYKFIIIVALRQITKQIDSIIVGLQFNNRKN